MTIASLSAWLRCPVCAGPLEPVGGLSLGCTTGHRFDVNKRGYVNLVAGSSKLIGDSREMLEARETVLESGLYSPIASVLADLALAELAEPAERDEPAGRGGGPAVLDAGVGTGYYLRAVLATSPGAHGLGMDLSPAAVARAVRPAPGATQRVIDGLVADTWSPWPVRDGVCDVLLNVFAPRNLPEFHRTLRPGGNLLVVVPLADHLAELRATAGMLDVPTDKANAVIDAATPLFDLREHRTVRATLPLSADISDALIRMGPSAHHTRPLVKTDRKTATGGHTSGESSALPSSATLAVDVLSFARR